eukprot:jgi/Mesen1/6535/ME000334S05876
MALADERFVNATNSTHSWATKLVKGVPWIDRAVAEATWPPSTAYTQEFLLPVAAACAALILIHYLSSTISGGKKSKQYGTTVAMDGPGIVYRHNRYLGLLDTPFERATTIAALFDIAVERNGDRPLLGTRKLIAREQEVDKASGKSFEKVHLGEFQWESFVQVKARAERFASGLLAMGHGKTEKIAIFAETRAEWYITLQAAFRQKLTVVTVYASLGEDALLHSLNETEVTTVIVDKKQLTKVVDMASKFESLKRVVYMEEAGGAASAPSEYPSNLTIESFSVIEKLGAEKPAKSDLPSPSDMAVIMYTSGSTGLPKGVMMSHANLVATIAGVTSMVPNVSNADVYIAYLPLAHVLELVAETGLAAVGVAIGYGSPLTLIDSSNKVKRGTKGDAPELKPTLMAAVPAILDRIRDGVYKKIDKAGGITKKLFELAYARRMAAINGSWFGAWGLERILWDVLIFRKIRSAVGGRLRFMMSGGAPLSAETQRFMNICFGMPIGQGYGLTETCAGGTFSEWDDLSVGRVGPPIPSAYIKLVDWSEGGYKTTDKPMPRGEICIGGPGVTMGYYKNKKKTDEEFKKDSRGINWFYTGDIGQFHPDGVLEIIDRKKDIVKLQAGEYVSLGKVEAALQRCDYIDNIMMHADSTKTYAVALVTANEQALTSWASRAGVQFSSLEDLCQKEEATSEVIKSLQKVGKESKLERFEIPNKVKLLPEPWTPESGFVTAALKLKRENVRKAFEDDLKKLYA